MSYVSACYPKHLTEAAEGSGGGGGGLSGLRLEDTVYHGRKGTGQKSKALFLVFLSKLTF